MLGFETLGKVLFLDNSTRVDLKSVALSLHTQGIGMTETSNARLPLPPFARGFFPLSLYRFYTDLLGTIQQHYQNYGPVFRFRALSVSTVLLGAEANQWALVAQQKSLSSAKAWSPLIGQLFRGGLLLRDGADHRQHRKLLMPAFRQEALQYYLSSCDALIDQHIQSWPQNCADIYPKVKELTLEIAIRSFFGVSHPKEIQIYNTLFTQVVAGSIAYNRLPLIGRTYQQAVVARHQLVAMMVPLVAQRRKEASQDMVGQLCQSRDEEGQVLSDQEIIDQMIFILMAAHDTTASTLSSLFYELAVHPEWQSKLRQEADGLASVALAKRPDEMLNAQMVIRETLRRNTPLKVVPRVLLEDTEFQGFRLEKSQMVSVFPAFTHFMPDYWANPEQFDPLRFSPERSEHKKHSFAYAPFGGGFHTCLGQFFAEKFLAVILGKITSQCSWEIPAVQTRRFQQVPIHVPKGPLPVHLSRV